MKTQNNGGPAFPSAQLYIPADTNHVDYAGMSLRDWFAGMALASIVEKTTIEDMKKIGTGDALRERCASGAYLLADAMLLERSK